MFCPECGVDTIRIFGDQYCHKCNKKVFKKEEDHQINEAVSLKQSLEGKLEVIVFLDSVCIISVFYVYFILFYYCFM